MNNLRIATAVGQDEDTKLIRVNQCVFRWQDIMGMEDDGAATWEYPKSRVWLWVGYKEFYIEGVFEEVFKEWQAWLAENNTQLAFSRS